MGKEPISVGLLAHADAGSRPTVPSKDAFLTKNRIRELR